MSLTHKITAYLDKEPDFQNEVIVQDDGDGPYIKEWNIDSKPQPSNETLNNLEVEAKKLENDTIIKQNRINQYPDIGDQLDALYHAGVFPADMTAKLKKVKDDNPKG